MRAAHGAQMAARRLAKSHAIREARGPRPPPKRTLSPEQQEKNRDRARANYAAKRARDAESARAAGRVAMRRRHATFIEACHILAERDAAEAALLTAVAELE
jgi:hypothetical protein